MKSMKTAEFKDALSMTLREVERGTRVLVTDRDRPVAMLVPIEDEDGVTIMPATRPFTSVRSKRYPKISMDIGSSELLRIERDER